MTVFHSGLGDLCLCHKPGLHAVLVPKLNCFNAKEMGRRCQQTNLLGPRGPGHSLGLPTPIPSLVYPKDGAHSGLKEL